jgi:hypothetical protein
MRYKALQRASSLLGIVLRESGFEVAKITTTIALVVKTERRLPWSVRDGTLCKRKEVKAAFIRNDELGMNKKIGDMRKLVDWQVRGNFGVVT